MEVIFYRSAAGRCPVRDELDALPVQASAHAYELLEGIEKHGFDAPRVIFKPIRGKIWEIKMTLPGTGGYRIFYAAMSQGALLLLEAFPKKTQKAPPRHIENALRRFEDAIRRGF